MPRYPLSLSLFPTLPFLLSSVDRFVELRRTFHFDFDCDCDARFVARVKSVAQTIDKLIDKLTKLPRDKGEREKGESKRGTEESGKRRVERGERRHSGAWLL